MVNPKYERLCFFTSVLEGERSSWQIAKAAVRHGVGGLELMNFSDELKEPDMKAAKEIGAYARENGLKLPCFSCGVSFIEDRREKIEYIKRYADICSELEIPYLHHTLISALDYESVKDIIPECIDIATECALIINEYAKERGVATIVEEQGYAINGINHYSQFMERTENKIGVLLDTGNIMFYDQTPQELYGKFRDRVKHIHLKDCIISNAPSEGSYKTVGGSYINVCRLGKGAIDNAALAKAFREDGYDGFYSLEYRPPVTCDEELAKIVEEVAKIFN